MRALICFIILIPAMTYAKDCDGPLTALGKRVSGIYRDLTKDTSPFNYACRDPKSFAGRPETPWYSRAIPQKDARGRTSPAFLKLVAGKVHQKIRENRLMTENLRGCMRSLSPACNEAKTWVRQTLPEYVKDTRFELSLAQSPYQVKSWIGSSDTRPNSRMSDLGSPKMTPWDPLTPAEERSAQKALDFYKGEIQKQLDRKRNGRMLTRADIGPQAREMMNGLLVKRFEHFQNYQAHVANVPLLQYLHSESPTPSEVVEASNKMLANLDDEAKRLKDLEAPLARNVVDSTALGLLEYSTLVEETLLEHPEFCGVAVSLQRSSEHRGVQNAVAIALPILAVSIVAPPLAVAAGSTALVGGVAATGIGAVAGVGFLKQSQNELNRERTRSFSQFYGNIDDLNRVARLTRARDMQVYTLPLAFGGTGALGSMAGASTRMASAIKTLTRVAR